MAVSVADLRACGERIVTLVTAEGSFAGRIVAERLSDGAVMVMLERTESPAEPVVIAIDAIEAIVER